MNKRYNGDLKAVSQLRRYVEKIKESRGIEQVRGVLACPKISPNALKMLERCKASDESCTRDLHLFRERYQGDAIATMLQRHS